MKASIVFAIATVVVTLLAYGIAVACVETNAAGALLSLDGVRDPMVLVAAGGFVLGRLGSAAAFCLTVALFAAQLTAWVFSKVRPSPVRVSHREERR